ncbi:lipopolysaccharide biosynthesis protein [Microtetraspora niveoalba]|uniref:lipopolysaccharide biosynthesis protein n=1 Tax=Microtetraspora niveoalba TaxID=46175 RepID=UPI000836036D|nr:lipopolysaccharide biosynthesis protein [Microtetraspora niveoalba]
MTEILPRTTPDDVPREDRGRAALGARFTLGLRDPLLRNAYALMVSAIGSGGLGLIYWVLAARLYDTANGGRAMAAIGAMRLLAAITSFGFVGTLTRFIPDAGRATGRFIRTVYLVSLAAAGLATVVFLLTLDRWGDNYRDLAGLGPGALFVGAVLVWAVFTLQDVALTGLRRATWVPFSTIGSSLVKIVLLVALAGILPAQGITVSWVVAVALSVLPVNLLMFRRLVPRHARDTADRTPPTVRAVGRFLAGDYLGSTFILAITYLLPVIVGVHVDATTYNYYYSTGMLGGILEMLAFTMASSLTVEGVFDRAMLAQNARRALARALAVLGPAVLVIVVLAPYVMAVFGPGHAAHATALLRLIALAAIPRAVIEIYLGVLRARSRARTLAVIQGAMCVLAFGGTFLLLPRLGINGVGAALLGAQLTVALAITPSLLNALLVPGRAPAGPVSRMMVFVATIPQRAGDLVSPLRRAAPGAAGGWPERARRWVLPVLAAEGFAIFVFAMAGPPSGLTGVDAAEMNGLGLVSVIPPVALGGLALLVVSFFVTLAQRRYRPVLLLAQLFAVTFCLHGASALVSQEPRFPTAWLHAGFVEFIARSGETLPGLDARFSWPGFFSLFAFAGSAMGMDDLRQFMNWYPVAANILYLVPLLLILRRMRADRRAKWLAAILFVTLQWIGQDYFSPQGTTYFMYLLFLAILVTWFGREERGEAGRPPRTMFGRLARRLDAAEPGEFTSRPADTTTRIVLFAVLLLLGAAATASHQITPFMIAAAALGLVVVRRCSLGTLPWLVGGMAVAWISYLATPYWAGHLGDMFGAFGSLVSNLTSNTTGRIAASTGDPLHALVLKVRLGFAAVLALLAGVGLLRRLRRKVVDRVALVLTVMPVSAMAMQSYGGEMGLRVYFFMLPGACLLAAYAFFPSLPDSVRLREVRETRPARSALVRMRARVPMALAFVTVLGLAGGFYVAKYGNEQFERVTSGEAAALDYIYAHDEPSARVLMLTPTEEEPGTVTGDTAYSVIPWREKHVERIEWMGVSPPVDPTDVAPVVSALRESGPGTFLLAARSQETMMEVTDPLGNGFPRDWGVRIRAAMAASPDLVTLYANRDAAVYALRRPPAGSVPPAADLTVTPPGATAWTPVGVAAYVLYTGTLVAAETMRLTGSPRPRTRRRLIRAAAVLLLVAAAVVVERFLSLGL